MEPKTNPLNQLLCTILTRIKNCYVEFFEIIFLMCLKFRKIYTIIVFVVLRNIYIFLLMFPRALKPILPHFSSNFFYNVFQNHLKEAICFLL
jgi:hypothetical protein